ncbi:MAG: chemotaxis protein CheA [Alphaproteobacteria bacterium]|nr:chemotaxis protein CheA [Alphaproteobacteria bacterium]MBU1525212.1 chemotaxis protein CheA [Alphaproteobacteria bacterium]MBU2117759.1 chemotaxis protein CheA [Alphaproteobacteria bacterium]MBU2352208.1 chemotaxis protein CheA [Alphaproteobacteria bacterium]MBU2381218.1 chemotaxis protein CheA [Alphaproteobacteria bacterium]
MDPMEAIRATFFQECDELLADLEAGLLRMQGGDADGETVNAVFRAVHSVKGGAGAFGLDDLVRFAHVFETTLDEVRAGRLTAEPATVVLMLRASDILADHVTAAKGGPGVDEATAGAVADELARVAGVSTGPAGEPEVEIAFVPAALSLDASPVTDVVPALGSWAVKFTPLPALYRNANDALRLLREMERVGEMKARIDESGLVGIEDFDPELPRLIFEVALTGPNVTEGAIAEVFEFVEGDCVLEITPPAGAPEAAPPADGEEAPDDVLARLMAEVGAGPAPTPAAEAVVPEALSPERGPQAASSSGEALVQTTIRVDLERVDRLIDLVGELVINQAMLAQRVVEAGLARNGAVAVGLDDLEQLTRQIQDSVMAIRAQPVKSVFQRMPRLVREVAAATGKQVRLVTDGEGTEVDKTVIERLSEPITHMIRNAIDHGLERPDARRAAGKAGEGTVRLSAQHRSGRIVIEVSDDGAGINRERVRSIAVSRGLIPADALLSDDEIDNLIFAPGFSTADAVSDISGRGVGMDVVKRSIQALGGRITISSRPGEGSTFTMSLPLTLAVLDGMVVTVGDHTLVVPINVIVESLQPKAAELRPLGPQGTVLSVRGSHVPMIDVAPALGWSSGGEGPLGGVTLLVESELGLAALRVDAIQGQRQVVIKSLEQNYRQVEGVAAATILGDGRVALILDVDGLIAARRRSATGNPVLSFAQAS